MIDVTQRFLKQAEQYGGEGTVDVFVTIIGLNIIYTIYIHSVDPISIYRVFIYLSLLLSFPYGRSEDRKFVQLSRAARANLI